MSKLKFDFADMHDRLVFLVQIDGMAYDRFDEMLWSGELPNLKSLLDNLPGSAGRVISTYPSATAPSLPEMFTGRWCRNFFRHPRKINAFDRVQKRALKYEFIPEAWAGELIDLFDIIRQRGDEVLSFFSGQFNAAAITYHDSIVFGLDALGKFSGREIANYDRKVMDKLLEFLDGGDLRPRLTFIGINGVDLAGHFQGPDSDTYTSCLAEADSLVGLLIEMLKRKKDEKGKPLFDKSIFVVFGDHGIVPSESFIDIATILKVEGFKVSDLGSIGHIVTEKINPFWMMDREILSAPGGSNITELYIRRKRRGRFLEWDEFCSYDELCDYSVQNRFQETRVNIPALLAEKEGIGEVLTGVYENVVQVTTPDCGSATIFRRPAAGNDTFAYRADSSFDVDPFGYLDNEKAVDLVCTDTDISAENWVEERFDHHFYSIKDWVMATLGAKYPAAVPLIPKAFSKHHTTSDIIVNAKAPYNFSKYFKGDHGILEKGSVTTGMLIAGPGIRPQTSLDGLMLIDMLPTLLKLLNIRAPAGFERFLDGEVFRELIDAPQD